MGNPLESAPDALSNYKIDISHQEMDRIIDELEQICATQPDATSWLPVENIGSLLCHELGYEDEEEFEDALKGSFYDFVGTLPQFETKTDESGKQTFRLLPPPPPETLTPTTYKLRISSRQDLWRVCLKSPVAKAAIPEIEFEVGCDNKRRVDSIYNHVAAAAWNLGSYVRQQETAATPTLG
eukprot:gene23758-28802_t